MNKRSKWIWLAQDSSVDCYAEFYDAFFHRGEKTVLRISADSNYAVYVNGALAACGQYPDFPHYKVYDEVDITERCHEGANHLGMIVWYYGQGNMSYFPGRAAVRYELWQEGNLSCCSTASTLSRLSSSYQSGRAKTITSQLGFGFRYDLTREDLRWLDGHTDGFEASRVVEQDLPMYKRPVFRPVLGVPLQTTLLKNEENCHFLLDLERESVGLLTLRMISAQEQNLLITYGEHIVDGGVRRWIDGRDFSMEVRLRPGVNEYVNPFRRLGLRYVEVFAQSPVQLERMTIIPVEYPVHPTDKLPQMDEQQKQIYATCVRTLELCMHDHYEDSPWREQALYALDSRNQMLCGYMAFEEYAFARANLLLMSKDERPDGLLSICTPCQDRLAIPSFSLHFFTAVYEYTLFSGDSSLAREIWPKLLRLMSAFTDRLEKDCLPAFEDKWHWNFYEWSPGMSGKLFEVDEKRFDAALNCLLSMAIQSMQALSTLTGCPYDGEKLAERINAAIRRRFYDERGGMFINSTQDPHPSVLVNSLAVLCGAADDSCRESIAARLSETGADFTPATLSTRCFQYDALLRTDREKYRSFVLEDIRQRYVKMLEAGATAFWETELGESDFDNAGSLCHGWSAMPVYYYHTLLSHGKTYRKRWFDA